MKKNIQIFLKALLTYEITWGDFFLKHPVYPSNFNILSVIPIMEITENQIGVQGK